MKIKIMGYELFEAISLYTKAKYGAELVVDLECHCMVEINEWKPKYLKDANDKYGYLRDEKGHAMVDPKKKQFVDHRLPFGEMDEISFHTAEVTNDE